MNLAYINTEKLICSKNFKAKWSISKVKIRIYIYIKVRMIVPFKIYWKFIPFTDLRKGVLKILMWIVSCKLVTSAILQNHERIKNKEIKRKNGEESAGFNVPA